MIKAFNSIKEIFLVFYQVLFVEAKEKWYEKLQEEIKLETAAVHRVFGSRLRLAAEVENKK